MENPRYGGAWWAAVYGVTQSRTRLKRLSSSRVIKPNSQPKLLGNPILRYTQSRTTLVVQWLRRQASNEGDMGSIPGQGTKIPHAMQCSQKEKKKI